MHTQEPNLYPLSSRPTPYETPRTHEDPASKPAGRVPHAWAFGLAATPLVGGFVAFALQSTSLVDRDLASWAFVPALLAGVAAMGLAVVNLVRSLLRIGSWAPAEVVGSVILSVISGAAAFMSSGVAAAMVMGSGRGRQLRRNGRPLHADVHDSTPWLADAAPQRGDVALQEVAEAWRTNGKTEHASVAAFAELSIELVALGAPPELIAGAHEDALDEMRHTEQCFGLAHQLDGRARGPRDFPAAARMTPQLLPRSLRLAHLAVTSLYDGALYEGLSARVVASLAKSAEDVRVREVLDTIARDEARHAAHGFAIVRWCVEAGGAPVKRALEVAIDRMRDAEPHALIEDPRAADGRWERWGIPGRARELAAWAIVRDRVVARTERLLDRGVVVVS